MENFRNGFLTKYRYFRRSDMAHSPFVTNILNTEERRSRLFPDKRRIPGRKAKFILTLGVILQLWGMRKVVEIRKFFKYFLTLRTKVTANRRREDEIRKVQRKSAPFLQAINDLRYCSLQERNEMLMKELFAHKGEDYVKRITQRFNQTDIWAPFTHRYAFMYNKTIRNVKPYHELWFGRYLHNFDVYNV